MSFLQPWMLAGLLAGAVPILIHLIHKRKPRRQPFAAIELLLRSVQRVERRWRLKRFLLLAARVTLLCALALAAARPILGGATSAVATRNEPERIAVVIDGSLSMRAKPGDRTAFARAITEARNLVDGLGPEDQMVLVLAAGAPRLVVERPTGSRSALLAALDALSPTWEHAELGEAVTAAAQALASDSARAGEEADAPDAPRPAARVVLLSDLAGHSIRAAADLSVDGGRTASLEVIDVLEGLPAASRSNRAITELQVANVPGHAPRTVEARARIRDFTAEKVAVEEPVPADLTLRGPDGPLHSGSVDLVPGTVVDKTLAHAFEAPGFVPVSVALEADVLAEDDARYAMADVRREVRTLIVDGAPSGVPKEDEIFYLERALAAGAQDQPPPRVITSDDLARTDLSAFDVLILAGVPSLGADDGPRLVEFVERGGGLWISACEAMDVEQYSTDLAAILPRPLRGLKLVGADAAGSSGEVGIGEFAADHPITEVFGGEAAGGLESTRTRAYLLLQPERTREARVLASFDDGQPALVEASVGRGRVLLLTTSVDRDLSDLPIRPAFLPLVRRSLLYLGGALARPDDRRTLVGERRALRVPAAATRVEVTGPDGQPVVLPTEQGTAVFEGTALPGHYTVRVGSGGAFDRHPEEDFAVNVDPQESDLRALSVEEATAVLLGASDPSGAGAAAVARLARRGAARPERLAAGLLLVMLLAFLLESGLTARRA
jgi:hypothetical protein